MIEFFSGALRQLPSQPLEGTAFRATQSRFLETPLSAVGSILTGGRYNPKGLFEVLYLAENPDTTLREVGFGSSVQAKFAAQPLNPYLLLSVRFNLQHITDISQPSQWAALRTNRDQLTTSWREVQAKGELPLTQALGIAARGLGLEALLVLSATDGNTNLAVFPDNLLKGSFIEVYDPHGQLRGRLEGHR